MNCKRCCALHWHPNKGFYCTIPHCNPSTSIDDVREIYERAFGKVLYNTDICGNVTLNSIESKNFLENN